MRTAGIAFAIVGRRSHAARVAAARTGEPASARYLCVRQPAASA